MTGPPQDLTVRPARASTGGREEDVVVHTVIESPLGALLAVADGDELVGLHFADRTREPDGPRVDGAFAETARQLREYFAGQRRGFDLPLAPRGSAFQLRVWQALERIPYGRTRSYGELARQLGCPGAAQAVGAANGSNPLAVVVPCHRVVGADGALTGYAGGLERKRRLLDLEAAGTAPALF